MTTTAKAHSKTVGDLVGTINSGFLKQALMTLVEELMAAEVEQHDEWQAEGR